MAVTPETIRRIATSTGIMRAAAQTMTLPELLYTLSRSRSDCRLKAARYRAIIRVEIARRRSVETLADAE